MDAEIAVWLRRRDELARRVALWINAGRADAWLLDAPALRRYADLAADRPAEAPELLPEHLTYIELSRRRIWLRKLADTEARAWQWARAGRPDALLLEPYEIGGVQAWLGERPADLPEPSADVLAFIERSQAQRPPPSPSPGRNSLVDVSRSVVSRATVPAEPAGDVSRSVATRATVPVDPAGGATRSLAPSPAPATPAASALKGSEMEAAWLAAQPARPTPPAAAGEADLVDVSVFAPPRAAPDSTIMIQVMLHMMGDLDGATARATLADDAAALRASMTLDVLIPRGARTVVMLVEPALQIAQPVQSIVWRGRLGVANFIVKVPPDHDGDLFPAVHVALDAAVVGEVRFKLALGRATAPPPPSALQPTSPRRFHRAFFSYAAEDRAKTLEVAQCYRVAGIEVFQDVLSLDPGVRWERHLYQEIDRCDLFLLFWSQAASRSQWVAREAKYALERHDGSAEQRPELVPLILEGPPVPRPPDFLKHLHFNDWMRLAIVAQGLGQGGASGQHSG